MVKAVILKGSPDATAWWSDMVGQKCRVLEVIEETNIYKVLAMRTEPGFDPYPVVGSIPIEYIEPVEEKVQHDCTGQGVLSLTIGTTCPLCDELIG